MSKVSFIDYVAMQSFVMAEHVTRNCWFTARLHDKQSGVFVRVGDSFCQLFPRVYEFKPEEETFFTDFNYVIPGIEYSTAEKTDIDPTPFFTGKIKSYSGLFVRPGYGRYIYLGVSPQMLVFEKKIKNFVEVDVVFKTIGDFWQ
jgi:hypothetical protein